MMLNVWILAVILRLAFLVRVADPPDLYIAPYLQNVTPTSITVMWETKYPIVGIVEFGQNGKFDRNANEKDSVKIHEVHLTGLKPGETYDYRVRYGKEVLQPASFTTSPPSGTREWRLVVYGDNRSNPGTHKRNVEQIMKLKPGIVLNSGDLVARGKVYEQWKPQYFDPLRGLAEYVPIFPCLGNHEQNAVHYYNYMSLPNENREVYYSFDYANAHIISLNSNAKDAPFQLGEPQTEWLIRDLEANKDAEWKIVFFHHPLFRCHPTRGITAQRWVWQPIFDKYGVDLVINGHDHYYQRTYAIGNYTGKPRRGVYHLISGGGGAGTYPVVPKVHAAFRRQTHHITMLEVMGDRILGRAVDIDGNIFDAFVMDKQAVNSPEEFISYEIYQVERDLGQAIRQLPLVPSNKEGVKIDTTLEVANPFQVPLRMVFSWKGANGWTLTPQQEVQILQPGVPFRIPIRAEARAGSFYPVPTAILHFTTPEGEKVFRNDLVSFFPVKLWPKRALKAVTVLKAPGVDGDLSDECWTRAIKVDDFVDVQGNNRPMRRVEAQVARNGDTLYVAAQMEAPEGITKSGYESRDNRRAPRNDHFRVHIGVGEEAYTFLVTAHGTELDAKGTDREWNSGFKAFAVATADGWQVEMAIPLQDLGVDGKQLRINLARKDATANAECELSPTFGNSSLDHRVPMFQGDWNAVERFAVLKMH